MNNNMKKVKTKVCSKCNEEKPLTTEYFNRRKASKDGFYGQCTDCRVAYNREYDKKNAEKVKKARREYYEENKKYIIEKSKEYHHVNKERINKRQKKYYQDNKMQFSEYVKKRYRENRSKLLEQSRRYQKENPDIVRRYKQKRKANKKQLPSTLTANRWAEIKKQFHNSCSYCGMTEKEHYEKHNEQLHQEHFIPLNKGGEYTHNNIIPACKSCNSSKHDSDFFEWYPTQESYSRQRENKILKYLNYENNKTQQLSIL